VRALAAALALLVLAAVTAAFAAVAPKREERIVFARAGQVLAAKPDGTGRTVLARGTDPAVAPDARRVAFVRGSETFVLDVLAKRTSKVGPGTEPAYSPAGRLARVVDGGISVDGGPALAPGRSPAWMPDGSRIAYATGTGIAILDASGVHPLALPLQAPSSPAWSPDGSRLVVEAGGFAGTTLVSVTVATLTVASLRGSVPGDGDPAWSFLLKPEPNPEPPPKPDPNELLPDLDQRAPRGLVVGGGPGRWTLGFASAVDNVGRGPFWVRGSRRSLFATRMDADQVIRLRSGGTRVVRKVGWMRYTADAPHYHWHLMDFDRYELRRAADLDLVVRDRKSGFCLADHYGHAGGRVQVAPAFFFGNCRQFEPRALSVEQGTSVGYTDRYPANFHGQNVELTKVPAGIYVLVHRANPTGRVREVTLANNAASARIRISWPLGRNRAPAVTVLRRCESSERCEARR
jgi:hypothetical protein